MYYVLKSKYRATFFIVDVKEIRDKIISGIGIYYQSYLYQTGWQDIKVNNQIEIFPLCNWIIKYKYKHKKNLLNRYPELMLL